MTSDYFILLRGHNMLRGAAEASSSKADEEASGSAPIMWAGLLVCGSELLHLDGDTLNCSDTEASPRSPKSPSGRS